LTDAVCNSAALLLVVRSPRGKGGHGVEWTGLECNFLSSGLSKIVTFIRRVLQTLLLVLLNNLVSSSPNTTVVRLYLPVTIVYKVIIDVLVNFTLE
jgi:hypothetical protein